MAYENYNIRQFKSAWFNKDYSEMSEEQFSIVYNEYIDTAEMYDSEELEKVVYIQYLHQRVSCIKFSIKLHRDFVREFGSPFVLDFKRLEQYGHFLKWNNDIDLFLDKIDKIEKYEMRYEDELENCLKLLKDFREKKVKLKQNETVDPDKKTRESFLKILISLRKENHYIDEEKTTVEDLALIIKSQKELVEELKSINNGR